MPDTYEVLLTNKAQAEIDQSHDWWAQNRSPEQANRWYVGFFQAMISLERNPARCPLAPESDHFPFELRELTYGLGAKPTHRAVFTIRDKLVLVLRIRHLAQRPIQPDNG
jgi:plasmid stabilization system protein ParE